MKFLKRSYLIAVLLGLAVFLAAGCGKKEGDGAPGTVASKKKEVPEAMQAEPMSIKDVAAVYSIRHPKLILEDFNKFTQAVPEAAMATYLMSGQLTEYGFPNFSELKADTNIGVVIPNVYREKEEAWVKRAPVVIFAKFERQGAIYRHFVENEGWHTMQEGEWTLLAKREADFKRIKDMQGILNYISKPQTEEVRCYATMTPNLLKGIRKALDNRIENMEIKPGMPSKEVLGAYSAIAMDLLEQLHSGDASLDLGDSGIVLDTGLQLVPDSRLGTLARYRSEQDVKIAENVPAENMLLTGVYRFSTQATEEMLDYLGELLTSVDYPLVSDSAKKGMETQKQWVKHIDGSAAMLMDVQNIQGIGKGDLSGFKILYLYGGNLTPAQLSECLETSVAFSNDLLKIIADIKADADSPSAVYEIAKNVFTVDGVSFDEMKYNLGAMDMKMSYYYGVVDGNILGGSSEELLKTYIPAIRGGVAGAKTLSSMHALKPYQVADMKVHGDRIMNMILEADSVNTGNPDILEALEEFRSVYRECPVEIGMDVRQAKIGYKITVPYMFIGNTVKLVSYVKMAKRIQ